MYKHPTALARRLDGARGVGSGVAVGVSWASCRALIVKALALASKMMLSTVVILEVETSVVWEKPNVAVSAGPLGTPIGVQLAAVFQSPETGSRSHWALIA
jgi:hypothetical protein